MALLDRVKGIIVSELKVAESRVTEDAAFVEDLETDSLGMVELVMKFEDEFEIEIPEEDAEKLRTVGDAVKYLEARQVA